MKGAQGGNDTDPVNIPPFLCFPDFLTGSQ